MIEKALNAVSLFVRYHGISKTPPVTAVCRSKVGFSFLQILSVLLLFGLVAGPAAAVSAAREWPDSDLVLLVRNPVFQKAVAQEMRSGNFPRDIASLSASLQEDGIAVEGRMKGRFVAPSFALLIDFRVPAVNRVLIRINSVRIYGVELRRFAGLFTDYIIKRLGRRKFAKRVTLKDRGRASDGAYELYAIIRPAPGWPDLTGLETMNGEWRVLCEAGD